jgi:uncharacterized membrane protein
MVVLILIVVILAIAVVRLQHALTALREDLAAARLGAGLDRLPAEQLERLNRRVAALEAQLAAEGMHQHPSLLDVAPTHPATPDERAAPVGTAPAPETRTDAPAHRVPPPPVTEAPPPPSVAATAFGADERATMPVAASTGVRETGDAPPAPPAEAWEVVVGTSWLNKIGVFVFVIGVALLLGYSMANIGPLGRVAMGYALSLAMLGTGVVLERRDTYRNYAYGLMGGGWAATYFTAYAMHAVPAARIVESELAATASLVLVAGGMIVHSLRYRSQTLTALAYVAAYAPLAFSPLSAFSLLAAVPLTATLLAVSARFAWSGVAMLGVAAGYGIFIFRTAVLTASPISEATLLVLWVYWLMFEIGDIASRRRRDADMPAPLFALNAAGFLGALLLHSAPDERQWLLMGTAASAYLASACARALILGRSRVADDEKPAQPLNTMHGATALAAALFAYAVVLRLDGAGRTLALLVETQMLVAAGVTLADRHLRRIGTALAVLVTVHIIPLAAIDASTGFSAVVGVSPVALLVAAAWHGNVEWLRRRQRAVDPAERLYGWAALVLLLLVARREVSPFYQGVAALAWALVLLEAGLRRTDEYQRQAYAALGIGAVLVGDAFLLHVSGIRLPSGVTADDVIGRHVWVALPAAIALAYAFAARLTVHDRSTNATTHAAAAGFAATIATAFVVLFEYRVTPEYALAAVWGLTATTLASLGAWRAVDMFRWHGFALGTGAFALALPPLLLDAVDSRHEYAATASAVLFLYLTGYIGRLGAAGAAAAAAGLVALGGSLLQTVFVWRVVPPDLVAPVWAGSALAIVLLGALRGSAGQRWQAYALIVLATARALAAFDGGELTTRQSIASGTVVALAYVVGYLGRALRGGARLTVTDNERQIAGAVCFLASMHLVALMYQVVPPAALVPSLASAGVMLTALGVWRARTGQRWQGYGCYALAALSIVGDLTLPAGERAPLIATASGIGILFASGLLLRARLAGASGGGRAAGEETIRLGMLVVGTVLLSGFLARELDTGLVTLAWGLEGAALLVVGFLARERVLRLSGLALLFLCILKLFAYDLRQLEALARILSFVVLGLVLLAVSWFYTRYREHIRRLL